MKLQHLGLVYVEQYYLSQNLILLKGNQCGNKKSRLKCSWTSPNMYGSLYLAILVADNLCMALKQKTKCISELSFSSKSLNLGMFKMILNCKIHIFVNLCTGN